MRQNIKVRQGRKGGGDGQKLLESHLHGGADSIHACVRERESASNLPGTNSISRPQMPFTFGTYDYQRQQVTHG